MVYSSSQGENLKLLGDTVLLVLKPYLAYASVSIFNHHVCISEQITACRMAFLSISNCPTVNRYFDIHILPQEAHASERQGISIFTGPFANINCLFSLPWDTKQVFAASI